MYFSFFIYIPSSQSPERSTATNKLQLLAIAERLGEESNSPLSLQVPDVMYALDGSGILSGHFPERDIATTRDTQELNEHRSVDDGGVPYIQRVCCSISKSEATLLQIISLLLNRHLHPDAADDLLHVDFFLRDA